MKTSEQYYNELAERYRSVSESRKQFLNAVDQYVINAASKICSGVRYLDVGAGDGYRSLKIVNSIKPSHTTLLDNSEEMAGKIPKGENLDVVIAHIQEFEPKVQYDLITCLWNVLGHFASVSERRMFFEKAKKVLSTEGRLILDVNNRYNIAEYGYQNVMDNLTKDLRGDSESGWFNLKDADNETRVYIHAPCEIDKMVEDAGLEVEEVIYFDYRTGESRDTFFEGQLLYLIKQK
ncbi:MAG: class I SAM-dependent methyltransferase [Opitutaceae bacterium]